MVRPFPGGHSRIVTSVTSEKGFFDFPLLRGLTQSDDNGVIGKAMSGWTSA